MSIDNLLSRLSKVKPAGKNRWRACCPAHNGGNATSLTIALADSGAILLKCWAEDCSAQQIAEAVGLEITDLFPPSESEGKPIKRPFYGTEALRGVYESAMIICAIAKEMKGTEEQMKKLTEHTGKIGAAMDACGL